MFKRKATLAVALLCSMIALSPPASASHGVSHTAVMSNVGTYTSNPSIFFTKNTNTNSTLTAYGTIFYNGANRRYRLQMRAGSGTGTNDCTSNVGWLPNGSYSPEFMYKTWGKAVVQGNVWYLGNKMCSNGSQNRTELYIHSSGIEGTAWNGNYNTEGCIKISQLDRGGTGWDTLKEFLRVSHNRDSETLNVSGP
jgi:hypothetical protein